MGVDSATPREVQVTSLLGGSQSQIGGEAVQGGHVISILGSSDLDLRRATATADGASIRVFALFGSVRITVPEDWATNVQTRAFLGSVVSKRIPPESSSTPLTLTGLCLLGSLEVRS